MNNSSKIYTLSFIHFLVGTLQFVFVGILDTIAASVGVSVSTAGQLITVYSIAGAIGTPLVMMATAKWNRRKHLLFSLIIIIVSVIITIALPFFSFLMASRMILGLGAGIFSVTSFALAAKLAKPNRQASAMANLALGSSVSLILGVPLGRVIASNFGWEAIFWGIGLLILVAFLIVFKTFPSIQGDAPVSLGQQLALMKNPKIMIALFVTLFMFISYSTFNTYITPYLSAIMPSLTSKISILLSSIGFACLVGSKLGGFLADRIGASRTLVWSMTVQAAVLALVPLVSGSAVAVIALILIWAVASWTTGPILSFNLISIAPESAGVMLSLNSSFVQVGFAVGAILGGIAIESFSILSITWIGTFAVALAATLAKVNSSRTYSPSLSTK